MGKEKGAPSNPTPAVQAAMAAAAAAPAHPADDDTGPVTPTHPCIRVRNAHDAHVIMEAVRMDLLPLVNRRLTPAQRKELGANGSVYVWERVEGHPRNIKRWDDSIKWRPGLNINPFEIFEERGDLPGQDRKNAKTRPDRNLGRPKGTSYLRPSRRPDVPIKANGMTRQVYTADVQAATDLAPRRWHLVCYYRKSELDMVPTVEQDSTLSRVRVPAGVYRSVTKNIRSLKHPIPLLTIPGETDTHGHPPVPAGAIPINIAGSIPVMLPMPPGAQEFIAAHMQGSELLAGGVMALAAAASAGGIYQHPPPPPPPPPPVGVGTNGSGGMEEDEDEEMDGEEDEDESDDDTGHGGYGPRTVKSVSASGPRHPPPPPIPIPIPVPAPATAATAAAAAAAAGGRASLSFARGEPPLGPSPPRAQLGGGGGGPQGPPPPPPAHVAAMNYPAGRT